MCAVGTCVEGMAIHSGYRSDTTEPAFTFGTVEVPAGAAPDYSVAINYEAVDPNGNSSGIIATTVQVVPVVSDFLTVSDFNNPLTVSSYPVTMMIPCSMETCSMTVTGTPGAVCERSDRGAQRFRWCDCAQRRD